MTSQVSRLSLQTTDTMFCQTSNGSHLLEFSSLKFSSMIPKITQTSKNGWFSISALSFQKFEILETRFCWKLISFFFVLIKDSEVNWSKLLISSFRIMCFDYLLLTNRFNNNHFLIVNWWRILLTRVDRRKHEIVVQYWKVHNKFIHY